MINLTVFFGEMVEVENGTAYVAKQQLKGANDKSYGNWVG